MFSKINSFSTRGIDGYRITVEVDVSDGLPSFVMVGYLAEEVREAQERVRTALRNAGFCLPPKRITVNLSPAGVRKEGTGCDLAIAAGILMCLWEQGEKAKIRKMDETCPEMDGMEDEENNSAPDWDQWAFIGELGLDGSIKPLTGVLSMVYEARRCGMKRVFLSEENVQEGRAVDGIEIVGVRDPFFDGNARDAARFIFGADVDEVIWHDGWVLISEEVTLSEEQQELPTTKGPILEGNRNNTLSRFAGRVLKRYGETDKAHEIFLEEAEKCNPPLDDSELQTIWFSAIKFFRNKVSSDSGYVPPDQFNDDFGGGAGSLKPEDYSDVGQAKVLSREYGDELKYTAATDYIRYDGEVWVEDKQMAVGACVEFLDLQLQDAKDSIEEAKKALVDAGYDEATVNQGSKALAKDIHPEHLGLFYMLVGAEHCLCNGQTRRP